MTADLSPSQKALATSWILQAVMIVLECVPGVMQDAGFQGVLKQFSLQTGYRLKPSRFALA